MVESFGALVAITLTMLLASIQGPSGDSPRSIFESNALASLVSLTDGRACSPTSCRIRTDARCLFMPLSASCRCQLFGRTPHDFQARPRCRFGRRHHRAFDDRRVAHDDAAAPRFGHHLDRHFAVGFRASEVNKNGDAFFRPRFVDCRHDRFDVGTQTAIRITAAPAKRHFVADHLLDHHRGAAGDVRGMRHNHDSYIFLHTQPSMTSATASTISSEDRAPGSICPMLRSPRNDARPRIAFIGMVFCAARRAAALSRAGKSPRPSRKTTITGNNNSNIVFWPEYDL